MKKQNLIRLQFRFHDKAAKYSSSINAVKIIENCFNMENLKFG